MPHLMFRGMQKEEIMSISTPLLDQLQAIMNCPRDYFTIELISTTFISESQVVKGDPILEIQWFERGQEVRDAAAVEITKQIQAFGYEDVIIMFKALEGPAYYDNAKHY